METSRLKRRTTLGGGLGGGGVIASLTSFMGFGVLTENHVWGAMGLIGFVLVSMVISYFIESWRDVNFKRADSPQYPTALIDSLLASPQVRETGLTVLQSSKDYVDRKVKDIMEHDDD